MEFVQLFKDKVAADMAAIVRVIVKRHKIAFAAELLNSFVVIKS